MGVSQYLRYILIGIGLIVILCFVQIESFFYSNYHFVGGSALALMVGSAICLITVSLPDKIFGGF
jgi:hypothetical protein